MNDDLRLIYAWVKGSRERLFAWTESLPPEVYTLERPDFAYGSLRNVQAHIADCYRVWIGKRGLGLEQYKGRIDASSLPDVSAMRAKFREVDGMLETALEKFVDVDAPLELILRPDDILKVTRRWLIMHPITHEFHHKGQMLAMGRILGYPYPPGPDTDLMLPFETQVRQ